MSINRAIASASAIVIAATGLVACNDSEETIEDKMDGSMAPSSEAMMSEESMAPSSEAMMSEDKMMEESK
ncbi:hypothetical protein [uncultured Corynebacterium sp.]|uniref:hypothetical protein n=1 Tax=uncultured Corynebacterium sp. TaxID=159447 RepID=UPI0025E22F6A|nr:hypothetical protein [uncultured Corynebacterium sp.]